MLRTFSLAGRVQGRGRANRGNLILSKCQTSKIKCRREWLPECRLPFFRSPFRHPDPALFYDSTNFHLQIRARSYDNLPRKDINALVVTASGSLINRNREINFIIRTQRALIVVRVRDSPASSPNRLLPILLLRCPSDR